MVVQYERDPLLFGQQGQRLANLRPMLRREALRRGDPVEIVRRMALVILDGSGNPLRFGDRSILLHDVEQAAFEAEPEPHLPELAAASVVEQVCEHLNLHIPDALLDMLRAKLRPASDVLADETRAAFDEQRRDLPGRLAVAAPVPDAQDTDERLFLHPVRQSAVLLPRALPERFGGSPEQRFDLRLDVRFPRAPFGLKGLERAGRSVLPGLRERLLHHALRRSGERCLPGLTSR